MTSDDVEIPQTLKAAVAERESLRHEILTAVHAMSIRREDLRQRIVPTTKLWEQSRPHADDKEAEFLRLHKSFLDLAKALGESQRESTASMKEVPSSGSTLKFIRNRATPTKSLLHEQKVIKALRSELSEGLIERSRIFDQIEVVANQMEALVKAETAN